MSASRYGALRAVRTKRLPSAAVDKPDGLLDCLLLQMTWWRSIVHFVEVLVAVIACGGYHRLVRILWLGTDVHRCGVSDRGVC